MLRIIINSLTIASGAVFAQLVYLLALPVLVRIYDPAAFGVFSVFFTAVVVLSSVASARYEQAIVLTRSDRSAAALTQLAFLVALGVCLMATILIGFVCDYLDVQFKVALGNNWLLVAATALPMSLVATLNMVGVRYDYYTLISASRTAKVCLATAVQVAIGASLLPGVSGLILGEFIGNAAAVAGCIVAVIGLHKRAARRFDWLWNTILWREMRVVARRFAVFPMVNTPHVLINGLAGWAIILLIGMLFSARELGFYFLMQRITMAPASLIGVAVSQVFFREAVTAVRSDGNFYRPLFRVILLQSAIGVPFALILYFFGTEIFSLAFGAEWRRAGRLAEIFAPYVAVHLVLASLAHTTIVAGRQFMMFVLSVIQNVVFMGGFLFGAIDAGNIEAAVQSAVFCSIFYMLGMIAWYIKLTRLPLRGSAETPSDTRTECIT